MEKYITRTIEQETIVPLWENDAGEMFRGEEPPEGFMCIGTAVVKKPPMVYRMKLSDFVLNAEIVPDK